MKIGRMLAGISLFCSSVWLGPAVSDALDISQIFGFVTIGGMLSFIAGALFWSGTDIGKGVCAR